LSNLTGFPNGDWNSPTLCDIDGDSDYDLFIGERYGHIWYFQNHGTPEQYDFADPIINWLDIDVGDYASPEFCDIDGDGDYDLFVGRDASDFVSSPGDVFFYENMGTPQDPDFQLIASNYLTLDVGTINLPRVIDFDLDNDLDLLYSSQNRLGFYENVGNTSAPTFSFITNDLLNGIAPHFFDLYDLDDDGDLDLVIAIGSVGSGEIAFYQNRGSPTIPEFVYSNSIYTSYILGTPSLVDIDADGDADLLVSYFGVGGFLHYENQGNAQQPDFVFITDNFCNISSVTDGRFVDMDNDDDFDLLAAINMGGLVQLYLNTGTPQTPVFTLWNPDLFEIGPMSGPKPTGGDIDDDGDIDVFVGVYEGGMLFFRNITGEPPGVMPRATAPYRGPVLSLGPNPANPSTWISFTLTAPQEATLAVYNILGAKVTTLTSGPQKPGEHTYYWNASPNASGVYIIRLETPHHTSAQRVVVLR